ncbi:PREDICTED: anther-specific protein LAT52-like [Ipomoea nil]|uniref:anther-specific protein LAT52-like n=1 Tax=Ipomoea nil TaxID=35883 RepID=UPI000901A556|nr:PREDICTED: anther-specific protein LAT52-like [Ipomoea nil]
MAKATIALVSAAICFLAFAGFAAGKPGEKFTVEGRVYCDNCRVQFETKISESLKGAVVRLDCKNLKTEKETYTEEVTTAANGNYSLVVEGDHEEAICDVTVVKSPREDCKETVPSLDKSEVLCSENAGIHSVVRYANPLFFMPAKPDPRCKKVLADIGYIPTDLTFTGL